MAGLNRLRSLPVVKAWGRRRMATGSGWSRGGGRGPHVVAERRARGGCRTGRGRRPAACAAVCVSATDDMLELVLVEQRAERMAAPRPSGWSGSIRGEIRFMALMAPSWRPASWTESGRRPTLLSIDRPVAGWRCGQALWRRSGDGRRESVSTWRRVGTVGSSARLSAYLFSTPRPPSRGASASRAESARRGGPEGRERVCWRRPPGFARLEQAARAAWVGCPSANTVDVSIVMVTGQTRW